jgi:DNA primase large subunit
MGITEVAGYYHNLKLVFDRLGIEAVFVDLSWDRCRYSPYCVRNLLARLAGGVHRSHA